MYSQLLDVESLDARAKDEVGSLNASKKGRDARSSRSHEVTTRLTSLRKTLKKHHESLEQNAKKLIWLTLNPGTPPKPRNKCNPVPPHHGEDFSAE